MGDIKLFRVTAQGADELAGGAVALEKALQTLFERNLEKLLGVRFLETEYVTSNGGRMDTLGIDENGCPVIIEYKRTSTENVINQGLFYLDWLMDHRADFTLLVMRKLGQQEADEIEWTAPRLICIANDFTKYDEHAVKQMQRNIELIRYRRFPGDLLLLDLLTATTAAPTSVVVDAQAPKAYKTVSEYLADADQPLRDLFDQLRATLQAFGDDVQEKTLRFYVAFKRIKNFACIEVRPQNQVLKVFVKVDPSTVDLVDGFTRDVSEIGHFGTGDLEITITSNDDLQRAMPLFQRSYEGS